MGKVLKRILTNRMFVYGFLVLIQILVIWGVVAWLFSYSAVILQILIIVSGITAIRVAHKNDNPAYKISWILFITLVPPFGLVFYFIFGNTRFNKARVQKIKSINRRDLNINKLKVNLRRRIKIEKDHLKLANFVESIGGYPLYLGSNCEYFKVGEEFFDSLIEKLDSAEKYIFLEYYIIKEGFMWDTILDILEKKAKAGVEIRIMYDDAGCLTTLTPKYYQELESKGIKAINFNPFSPTLNMYLNYRDHRKICVVDGKYGYIGGINFGDEYINIEMRFGHWKDTAILIEGDSVSSLTCMFLELWQFATESKESNFEKYIVAENDDNIGFVQPFGDSPLDAQCISESIYMHIINSAKKYVYITTPYLILDNEMVTALTYAAKSGVDVRIITPHIPDKVYVHTVSRSFYEILLSNGVKIYEYTPGFTHAKSIVSDDKIAVVGTINMDFRSFFTNFECGAILYNCPVISAIKRDFFETQMVSMEINLHEIRKRSNFKRLIESILKLFAPMM